MGGWVGDVNTGMIIPSGMCLVLQSAACVACYRMGVTSLTSAGRFKGY